MNRLGAGLLIATHALGTSPSRACDFGVWDEKTGAMLPLPTAEEAISESHVVFVGTVKGFRIDTTELLPFTPWEAPDCTGDPSESDWERCREVFASVISVVYEVEHDIKGVAAGRLYEETYPVHDSCGTEPEVGKRYLRAEGAFGLRELPDRPSDEQLDQWRALAKVK